MLERVRPHDQLGWWGETLVGYLHLGAIVTEIPADGLHLRPAESLNTESGRFRGVTPQRGVHLLLQGRTRVLRRRMGGSVPGQVTRVPAAAAERCGLPPRNLLLSICGLGRFVPEKRGY
jgi:hypothetical protein